MWQHGDSFARFQQPTTEGISTMDQENKETAAVCGSLSPEAPSGYRWDCQEPDGHQTDCEHQEPGAVIRWPRPRIGNRVELDV